MQQTQKTACSKCEGNVEFPVELRGQTFPCPHCGASVILGDESHDGEDIGQPASAIPTQRESGQYIPYSVHNRKQNPHVFLKILAAIFVGLPVLGLLGFCGYWVIKGTINVASRLWQWGTNSGIVVAMEVLAFLVEWSPWLFFALALLVIVRVARKQSDPPVKLVGSASTPAQTRGLSRESAFFIALAIYAFNKAWESHRALEKDLEQLRNINLFQKDTGLSDIWVPVVTIHSSHQLFWLLINIMSLLLLFYSTRRRPEGASN